MDTNLKGLVSLDHFKFVSSQTILFFGAGYLPVQVICWIFFLILAKNDQCG